MRLRTHWWKLFLGIHAHWDIQPSLSSRLAPGRRGSISVGPETLISFKTLIFTRDPVTGENRPVRIGGRCFIGGGSMILPGVSIGDGSIVGAGAVVFDDVPAGSIVVGNPAQVLRSGIKVGRFGRLEMSDQTQITR
jgi:maltose O-acetyltransferase